MLLSMYPGKANCCDLLRIKIAQVKSHQEMHAMKDDEDAHDMYWDILDTVSPRQRPVRFVSLRVTGMQYDNSPTERA